MTTLTRALLVGVLAVAGTPARATAQPPLDRAVLTTAHFAFYSDLATNVHDALIVVATARLSKRPTPFSEGEQACFEHLPADQRDAWNRAVDVYVAGTSTNRQRFYEREMLAGRLRVDAVADAADRQFLGEWAALRQAATPAYRRCRWPAQDALNRQWIDRVRPLLSTYERPAGERLPKLFATPWAGLPFRVDVVNFAPFTGANTATLGDPAATAIILVSSTNRANQGLAAVEVLFHEASHFLSVPGAPLETALRKAAADAGATMPPDIVHAVHFFMTGEAVRRVFAERGESYTPLLFSLELFTERFRDVIAGAWTAQVDGTRTLDQAAADLVRAMTASR